MNKYINENLLVFEDNCGRFIYEVFLFLQYDNVFSTVAHKYFSSDVEIKGIIQKMKLNKFLSYECSLYSAPLQWLKEHEFVPYVEPPKKKRIKKQSNEK